MTEADEARYLAEIDQLREHLQVADETMARQAVALGRLAAELAEAKAQVSPPSLPPAAGG